MKKLFILLLGAAVVGFALSRNKEQERDVPQAPDPVETAQAPAEQEGGTPPLSAAHTMPRRTSPPSASRQPAARPVQAESTPPVRRASELETPQPVAPPKAPRSTEPPDPVKVKLRQVDELLERGKRVEARAILTGLYLKSRGQAAQVLREMLDEINKYLVFNPGCREGAVIHTVQPGEVLARIGKDYGVNWRMIQRLNKVNPSNLQVGQMLKIIKGKTSIFACKSEFRLALLIDGAYVKEYPVGIGLDDRTPEGEFEVATMGEHATWYSPDGPIKYGEPGYQLGERWIGFKNVPGASGIGIHGTNDEDSIGTKCSNGCLRMYNRDVVELYDFIQMGSKVTIVE